MSFISLFVKIIFYLDFSDVLLMLLDLFADFLDEYFWDLFDCALEVLPVHGSLEDGLCVFFQGSQRVVLRESESGQERSHVIGCTMRFEAAGVTGDNYVLAVGGLDDVYHVCHARTVFEHRTVLHIGQYCNSKCFPFRNVSYTGFRFSIKESLFPTSKLIKS
jgi:hypothetical protein